MAILTKEERPTVTERPRRERGYFGPPANIHETADGYWLELEMPGVTKTGIDVSVENGELVILGRRGEFQVPEGWECVYRESRPLDYRRTFDLDPSIDTGKITATIDHGVLKLFLPKAEAVRPRKIKVS
jgi:HSP20 family protein